jgi:hypothetical protein
MRKQIDICDHCKKSAVDSVGFLHGAYSVDFAGSRIEGSAGELCSSCWNDLRSRLEGVIKTFNAERSIG